MLHEQIPTEETTLLRKEKKRTPLPKLQLAIILLIQICEPLASSSIYPYINQLVSELDITGGDEKKVGYYAGMESLFFLAEAMTVLQWSRASDHVGRKPILLIGFLGSAISILCFGLSRTFWGLVISRSLCGLLNGNIGVMKSAVGDMTDRTNRADAYVFIPIVWALGASGGPLIGGTLTKPHDRFPHLFTSRFWVEYPYFLPCLVTGGAVLVSWFIVLALFKETLHREPHFVTESGAPPKRRGPRPLRELLVFPVVVSVSNYVSLGFLNTTFQALLPLFLAMPRDICGLGLPPSKIGVILASYGFVTGVFQFCFFARLARRFGERTIFIAGMMTLPLMFFLLPVISLQAVRYGLNTVTWILLAFLLSLAAMNDLSFSSIFIFMTSSAPKSSRGSVMGMAQTTVALARAVGPAMSTSLFSLSVQHNLLGGYFVYFVCMSLACSALILAKKLPEEVWEDVE